MKTLIILMVLSTTGFITEPKSDAKEDVKGSWTLVKYRYGSDDVLHDVPEFMVYVKNITDTHFSWCSFSPEDGNVIGTGGGTYEFKDGKYVESTQFWFPSGTDIPGTTTAFDSKMKGNTWTISGFIRNVELNPSSGELEQIDSIFMEEVWQRATH